MFNFPKFTKDTWLQTDDNKSLGKFTLLGLSLYLQLFAILILLPVFGLIVYGSIEQRKLAFHNAEETGLFALRLASKDYSAIAQGAEQLLKGISQSKEIFEKPAGCSPFLADVRKNYKRYANIGVLDLNGNLICSAIQTEVAINYSDQVFFIKTISTKSFSVGRYRISPITKQGTIRMGYPIFDDATGKLYGVIYAALDLTWLNEFGNNLGLSERAVFMVIDKNGTILVRKPDPQKWVGAREAEIIDSILSQQKDGIRQGVLEEKGVDGVSRIYAFTTLGAKEEEEEEEESPLYLGLGFLAEDIYASANGNFVRNLIGIGITTIIALLITWIAGHLLILRRVRALQEINNLKTEFVSLVSHQLRTPMTGIRWVLERVFKQGLATGAIKEYLDDIYRVSMNLSTMVDLLLDVSRIEMRVMQVTPAPLDAVAFLKNLCHEGMSIAEPKNISINFVKHPATFPIVTDHVAFRNIIQSLLTNALEYTPKRGNVDLSLEEKESSFLLEIKDTGIGIPAKDQPKIFEKFGRASNATLMKTDGTGLGLYLAAETVKLLGGKIWLESEENKGTTFYVELPITVQSREGAVQFVKRKKTWYDEKEAL